MISFYNAGAQREAVITMTTDHAFHLEWWPHAWMGTWNRSNQNTYGKDMHGGYRKHLCLIWHPVRWHQQAKLNAGKILSPELTWGKPEPMEEFPKEFTSENWALTIHHDCNLTLLSSVSRNLFIPGNPCLDCAFILAQTNLISLALTGSINVNRLSMNLMVAWCYIMMAGSHLGILSEGMPSSKFVRGIDPGNNPTLNLQMPTMEADQCTCSTEYLPVFSWGNENRNSWSSTNICQLHLVIIHLIMHVLITCTQMGFLLFFPLEFQWWRTMRN